MKTNLLTSKSLRIALAAGFILGTGIGAANAADTAAPKAKSDSMGAAITDTAVTAKVKAKLMNNKGLSHVSVKTTNGVVTLEGNATSSEVKATAQSEVESLEGVKSVDNQIVTASSTKTESKMKEDTAKTERVVSDSWITTKVKSELLADSMTKAFKISVKTTKGVVVMTGSLPTQDAISHAKDIAEKVKGVKSVDTSGLNVASK